MLHISESIKSKMFLTSTEVSYGTQKASKLGRPGFSYDNLEFIDQVSLAETFFCKKNQDFLEIIFFLKKLECSSDNASFRIKN